MKLPKHQSRRTKLKRVLLAALVCGGGLLTAGCKIPCLRGPQHGPATPNEYLINNGKNFWNPGVYSTKVDESQLDSSDKDSDDYLDSDSDDADYMADPNDKADSAEQSDADDDAATLIPRPIRSLENVGVQPVSNEEQATLASLIKTAGFTQAGESPEINGTGTTEMQMNQLEANIQQIENALDDGSKKRSMDETNDQIKQIEDALDDGTTKQQMDDDANAEIDSIEKDLRGDEKEGADTDGAAENAKVDDIKFVDDGLIDTNIGLSVTESSAYQPQAAFYTDPFLVSLITETINGNQELKILSEEIRIACNEAYARSGEYRPFVTLGAGVGFDKVGRHTRLGSVEDQLDVASGRGFPEPLGDYFTAADVSWEIDIWHKLRNAQRSAVMLYLGTRDGRNYIITRMVSEVAENYYELLALDNQLLVLQRTIEIQKASLKVALEKKQAGRGSELAVQRFRAEVEKNKAEWTIIEQKMVEAENRINFLAGRYPQRVERQSVNYVDLNLTALGSGVPSELLRNRSDIRQAEREVAAAGLDIKVAQARFYPSLNLTAGLGWNAFRTGFLFRTPESLIYGLAGELVGPLINKRAIKAAYASANAAQLQSIYNYQQVVLEAHIEVVNHLSKVENFRRSIEVKKEQLDALEQSVKAANRLFLNARADYVDVLLAQRELQEARMRIIDTKQEQLTAVVNAYQALGGGGF